MFGVISRRFYHSSKVCMSAGRSSALGKLRKSTGYSVANCKKALELFPDDVSKAEEWLHAQAKQEGWAKWAKIQSRSASQGLIGVFSKDKIGVMVEVNCETDFVAKNAEFQQFVENIMSGCVNHISASSVTGDITKSLLNEAQLSEMKCDSTSVSELVSSALYKFNEKTVVKRAVCYKVADNHHLSSLSHPSTPCPTLSGGSLGKYGTLLVYKDNKTSEENVQNLGLNICQHIIGMNPASVGELTEKDIANFTRGEKPEEKEVEATARKQDVEDAEKPVDESEQETEEQDTVTSNLKDSEETRLLFQPFLLDPNTSVGETLFKNGLEIVDFERFECGESTVENAEAKEASSAGI
ncbi:elongation factor Ts, mitochondrial-like [Argiope bruennichi]|uniref:Elongation factor Ts, mitochondrial n=1 Tax=Argiope bruennichi TaxID=94029 RepID=A0A8T0EF19_ARGBR|nr:elongation factor Ts, mitochondrial-like [Argiope bruennichi]KAF8770575.1 Elongation factor Ts like protein [Argiope bruennichi]